MTFWQGILSPHQIPYIRALAEGSGWDVTVVAERAMSPDRQALGWEVPDVGRVRVATAASEPAIRSLIDCCGTDCIHLISGIRPSGAGEKAFRILRRHAARIGVISETAAGHRAKDIVKWAAYAATTARYRSHLDFVLAIGSSGVAWYRACGVPEERIFPFAYVTDAVPAAGRDARVAGTSELSLVFVGQLIRRKGCDLLLRSLAALPARGWSLTLAGDGPERAELERLARDLQIADRLSFKGALPMAACRTLIGAADLLVLPSRHDGWGAVANEALMRGVPVLCSDHCGAGDLLEEDWRGEVFHSGSIEALQTALSKWMSRGKRTPGTTKRIQSWASGIGADAIAGYFAAVMEHVYEGAARPRPPWSRLKKLESKA